MNEPDDTMTYKVVHNDEEQFSLWPEVRETPAGWHEAGRRGSKAECLAYIQEVWTDLRPKSLRRQTPPDSVGSTPSSLS